MVDKNTKKLTPKQNKALQALLTGATVQDVANNAGVSRQAVYDWLKLPHFKAALNEAEEETLEGVTRSLIALGDTAVKTIKETIADGSSESVRVRAADIALNRLLQMREQRNIEERLSDLEKRLNKE